MTIASWVGLASPFLIFVLHVVAYRLVRETHKLPRQTFVIGLVGLAAVLSFAITWLLSASPAESVHAAVLTVLYGYIYFHFSNMSETARRIRMLVTFVALGKMPDAESGYDPKSIFSNRLVRMSETGAIEKRGDKYVLKSTVLLAATKIILFWRRLFFAGP